MNDNRRTWPWIAIVLLGSTGAASAQTILVDTANDVIDFGGAQQVADLPGPDGRISLPEAGLASDNTPGVQTIGFHVPQSEWDYQWLFPGRAVLRPFLGFRVFDTVILDATTQTAFTGDTNPAGGEVVIWQETYVIDNFGGRVTGFDNSSINLSGGAGNFVQGNTQSNISLYDSASNLIGGTGPGEGNTAFAITIDRANNNVVVGNTVSRVRVLGWVAGGMAATNNRVGGPAPGERNIILGSGTWNSEGAPGGFAVQLFDTVGAVVENNSIGTTPDGLAPGHLATTSGVYFDGENHGAVVRNNRIAGITGTGIGPHYAGWHFGSAVQIGGTGSNVSLVGNTIGLDANGQPVLGSVTGISLQNYYLGPVQGVSIGGAAPGEGNEIAGHLTSGISVGNALSGVRIVGNSIHDNATLGIDLVDSGFMTGVSPNDPLDADSGGNGLQNFPVIQSVTLQGPTARIVGTLGSTPSSAFGLQFFASPACDSSGFGEGRVFLGSTAVVTDVAGNAVFDHQLVANVPLGWSVTATATAEPTGSTSEFSACVPIGGGTGQAFCFGDGTGTACPCANHSPVGSDAGCLNSLGVGGLLVETGTASLANDGVVLVGSHMPNSSVLYFQGTTEVGGGAGVAFGDGLRCASGTIVRLGTKSNVAGASQYPVPGDPSISVRGLVGTPGTRLYQAWYRNSAAYCQTATFNLTNGIRLVWSP